MQNTRIFLWRHPEYLGYAQGLICGQTDQALSPLGQRQAKAMAARMAHEKLDAVYASTLQRADLAAREICAKQATPPPFSWAPELCELNMGQWEGSSLKQIAEQYPAEMKKRLTDLVNFRPPQGESLQDLAHRVIPAFQRIIEDNWGHNICVISHAGVIRVMLAHWLGLPLANIFRLEQDPASLNIIDVYADGLAVLKLMNQQVELPKRIRNIR